MTNIRKTIIRSLAVATGIAAASSLAVAAPAAAATFTQSHFTMDYDSIVVGRDHNSDFKAFSGTLESFHDGHHLAAKLTGTFKGVGYLAVVWTSGDGSTSEDSVYGGSYNDAHSVSLSSNSNVVRAKIEYRKSPTANDSHDPYDFSQTVYVGDAPQSKGTCEQLDTDPVTMNSTPATFQGSVVWSCDRNTGAVLASVQGALSRTSSATADSYIGGRIEYADGSTSLFFSRTVTTSATTQSFLVKSNAQKHARYVDFEIESGGQTVKSTSVKLGDA
jgi:hypothetical protein